MHSTECALVYVQVDACTLLSVLSSTMFSLTVDACTLLSVL